MFRLALIILGFMLLGVLCAQEQAALLDRSVNLRANEQSIETVLDQLKRQYPDLVFTYSTEVFDMEKRVSVDLVNVSLKQALEQLFAGQHLECRELNGKIFFIKAKAALTATKPAPVLSRQTKASKPDRDSNTNGNTPKRRLRRTRVVTPSGGTSKAANTGSQTVLESTGQPADQALEGKVESKEESALTTAQADSAAAISLVPTRPILPEPPLIEPLQHVAQPRLIVAYDNASGGVPDYELLSRSMSRSVVFEPPVEEKEKKKREKKERVPWEKQPYKLRFSGSSTTAYTTIGGNSGIQLGGSLTFLSNRRLTVGFSGYAVQSSSAADVNLSNNDYRVAGGYGGLLLEYSFNPDKLFHLSFPLMIGGGGVAYVRQFDNLLDLDRVVEDAEALFVIEPGVNVEMNVLKYLKIGLGASYRYTSDATLAYNFSNDRIIENTALNSLSFGFMVKFGWF